MDAWRKGYGCPSEHATRSDEPIIGVNTRVDGLSDDAKLSGLFGNTCPATRCKGQGGDEQDSHSHSIVEGGFDEMS